MLHTLADGMTAKKLITAIGIALMSRKFRTIPAGIQGKRRLK
jgi:hypothetical protein